MSTDTVAIPSWTAQGVLPPMDSEAPASVNRSQSRLDVERASQSMTMQEYRRILAERTALENLLDQLSASSVIERQGLEFRREKVEKILTSHHGSLRDPARVRLTFRGKPAVDAHGILADFGATAVKAFTDAVAAVGAAGMRR